MKNSRPIMLVEDDQVDAMTVERAFKELKITNDLIHKFDGEEALEHLMNDGNKKPCIILLDLNMPKMSGLEFLKARSNNESLKKTPIIVLTTSEEDQDVVESFKLGVAGYMVKPVDYRKFVDVVKAIELYWTLSQLPNGG